MAQDDKKHAPNDPPAQPQPAEKPRITKFVAPEMDVYIADDIPTPELPPLKLAGHKEEWDKTTVVDDHGAVVCTCNKVCTCNLVQSCSCVSHRSSRKRSSGSHRGGGSRRVCSCVPVAH